MIFIGFDHGGYELKNILKKYLEDSGYEVKDIGADSLQPLDDFSYYGKLLAKEVSKDIENNKGIYLCGSGVGACIICNRYKHCYAANCRDVESVVIARNHNNINILNIGGRFVSKEVAKKMVDAFLNTEFLGGKYKDRMDNCDKI